jgi:myosin heavy subunit
MTKVLFLLSAVVMGVAGFFAFQSGRTFTEVRNGVTEKHKQIREVLAELTTAEGKVKSLIADVGRVQGEVDVESEKLKQQKLKLANLEGDTKRTQEGVDTKSAKLKELTGLLEGLPPDVKPETLAEDLNRIKQAIADLEAQAELKQKEVDGEVANVSAAQARLEGIARKLEERKKSFERNSMTARVVAVNNDWGFVVVDAGTSEGISESTKLLVIRGTQTVGKLSILSVQGQRTIANILPETLVGGLTVAPGDRVILENLAGG